MARGRKSGSEQKSREIHARPVPPDLLTEARPLIHRTRGEFTRAGHSALVIHFRPVGGRIRSEILQHQWTEYGERSLPTRSGKMAAEFGERYGARSRVRMVHFAKLFLDREIIATLFRRLGGSGIRVASDRTELPPRAVLERKLPGAIARATS